MSSVESASSARATAPRRGDEVVVRVEAFDLRGRALGQADGHRIRMRHGVPGATCRARVLRRRRGVADALALETIDAGPHSVAPRCAHFGSCGGCSFQDLEYAAQLAGKQRLVEQAFAAALSRGDLSIEPVVPAPERWAYRNKMEFTFGSRRWVDLSEPPGAPRDFALGLHAKNLYGRVVDVHACPIQSPRADAILASARAIALELDLPPWDVREHRGLLRHLVVRVARATGEILVHLVTSQGVTSQGGVTAEGTDAEVEAFARALLERRPEITTLVHGINTRLAATAVAERERVLHGPGFIREHLGGIVFALSASSFFQTNTAAAEVLLGIVREEAALEGGEVVWDLYCGTGTLSLPLFRSDRPPRALAGLEISPASVADARRNAELNGIVGARFLEGDVLDLLDRALAELERPDLVLLDPPRAGLHPRLFERLAALSPRRIVYVSCNPVSAAADVERLRVAGWRAGGVRPVDLFPHTPHVECVVGLSREGGSST